MSLDKFISNIDPIKLKIDSLYRTLSSDSVADTAADILGQKKYSSLSGEQPEEVNMNKPSLFNIDVLKSICKTIVICCAIQSVAVLIGYNLYVNKQIIEFQISNNENIVAIRAGLQQCYIVNEVDLLAIKNNFNNVETDDPIIVWKKDCNETPKGK